MSAINPNICYRKYIFGHRPFFLIFPCHFQNLASRSKQTEVSILLMAAFRIVYFSPATSHFSHAHPFLPPPPLNHRVLSLVTKPQRSNLQLILVNDNAKIRALAQSIDSESAVAEDIGVSNTRLLLQNVPWTCSADDLRPLLEKHGSVVDIEVSFPFPFSIIIKLNFVILIYCSWF